MAYILPRPVQRSTEAQLYTVRLLVRYPWMPYTPYPFVQTVVDDSADHALQQVTTRCPYPHQVVSVTPLGGDQ